MIKLAELGIGVMSEEVLALGMEDGQIGIITQWTKKFRGDKTDKYLGRIVCKSFYNLAYLGTDNGFRDFFEDTLGQQNWKLDCKVQIFPKGTTFELK